MTIDLFCLGRVSLDLFSRDVGAPFEDITGFEVFVGGTPLNIAVGAQRLGLQTAMLTGTSNDGVGRLVRQFLKKEGVNTDYMTLKPGATTNAFLLALQPPDTFEPTIYQHNNADMHLSVEDVRAAPVAQARALLFTGIGIQTKSNLAASLLAAETAQAHGGTVFMDVDYKTSHWHNADEFGAVARAALRVTDVAVGTEREICAAAGVDDPDAAAVSLLRLVREAVVVKRGERGATAYLTGGDVRHAPLFPVEVLNVFGAGDAFAAGLIYARLNGMAWAAALELAAACGAIIVTRHGCANDMPTLAQVRQFIG